MMEVAMSRGHYEHDTSLLQSYQEYWACEQSISSARASVMVYDDVNKKWVPSGTSSGLSKVNIFQHQVNNTFRVVGRKLQDHEVVINCAILKGLKYNQATATFHQWRDNKQVYGLNFSSKEDAESFARAMFHALDVLSNGIRSQPSLPPTPQVAYQPTNGQYDEDMGYSPMFSLPRVAAHHQHHPGPVSPSGALARTPTSPSGPPRSMTREEAAMLQERRLSQQQQILGSPGNSSPNVPQPPAAPGHHRTSSAPPAPQPPPMALVPTASPMGGPPPAPPAPPCPPWMGGAPAPAPAGPGGPPPPPPPPPDASQAGDGGSDMPPSLASQIQSAKLKRNKQSAENSGSSTSSGGSNYGTIGRAGPGSMSSMMDEMAKTLARRRKAVEKKEPSDSVQDGDSQDKKTTDSKSGTNGKFGNGGESPKMSRKRFGSNSEEQIPKVNGLGDTASSVPSADLETLKQEILREMRKEITKMKQDIIDAIKIEMSRR